MDSQKKKSIILGGIVIFLVLLIIFLSFLKGIPSFGLAIVEPLVFPVWHPEGGPANTGAYEFSGEGDSIKIPHNDDLDFTSEDFTFVFWVKPAAGIGVNARAFSKGTYNVDGYEIFVDNDDVFLRTYQGGTRQQTRSNAVITPEAWNHLAVVRSGSSATIYVNGADETRTRGTHLDPATSPDDLFIGQRSGGAQGYAFKGMIDEVMIFNRALSAEEVELLYNQGLDAVSRENLVGYWNFDDQQDLVNDLSGHNNNGLVQRKYQEIDYSPLEIDNAVLTINSGGTISSLLANGEEQLDAVFPLSRIRFNDNSYANSNGILRLDENRFRIEYANSDTEVVLKIEPKESHFLFTIQEVINPSEEIYSIELFRVKPIHVPRRLREKEWAENALPEDIFINFLSLQPEVECFSGIEGCKAFAALGLENRQGAMLVVPKREYFPALNAFIAEYDLPDVRLDGEWFKESPKMRESYLFATLSEDNYLNILEYLHRGNFKQLLMIQPVIKGSYNAPRANKFQDQNQFYNILDLFKDNNIQLGLHTFLNRVDQQDPLFFPVSESLYKEFIGILEEELPASGSRSTRIRLNNDLSQNTIVTYYDYLRTWAHLPKGYFILIGEELFECSSYQENNLLECVRNRHGTSRDLHLVGAEVFLVPNYVGFFINSENEEILERSTDSFREFVERFEINLLYIDGSSMLPKPGMKRDIFGTYIHQSGDLPYLEKLRKPIPCQTAGSFGSYGYDYFSGRGASNDGVVFKNKDYTKYYKWDLVSRYKNPYGRMFKEFGWWKIHGSDLPSGNFDFDAVTFDEIHYVMTKTLTMDTSIGVQLSNFHENHALLNELLDLIGLYHTLINEDIETGLVPQHLKDYLMDNNKEAEISAVSGWNLVEKKVDRQYAVWDAATSYGYSLVNPFVDQKLKVEIRPRFDYYPFDDGRHTFMSDFSETSVSLQSDLITCTIDNQGQMNIVNSGNSLLGCKIELPGTFILSNQRGVGLSITGHNQGETVIVSLFDQRNARRTFRFPVNFDGRKELLLGDPITSDGGVYPWDYSYQYSSWIHHYALPNTASVYVIVEPGSYNLQLHELKALQEKGASQLVNPTITINGKKVTFPVTLAIAEGAPYLLEYNAYDGEYKLYDTLYNLVGTGEVLEDNMVLTQGENVVEINSDTSDSEYSARAEVRISVYDDEDNDGVPTNGNYLESYEPCGRGNNFCDDNCPSISNSLQIDSNGDGVGDACGQVPQVSDGLVVPEVEVPVEGYYAYVDWPSFKVGEAAVMEIKKEKIGMTKISFTVGKKTSKAWMKVERIEEWSAYRDYCKNIYQVVRITEGNVISALKGTASVEFKVEKSWLDQNKLSQKEVALFGFSGKVPEEFKTSLVGEDKMKIYYRSEVPQFGLFVIGNCG